MQNNHLEDLCRDFHVHWDHFPAPVLLIHKDRRIVARNAAAEALQIKTGGHCYELSSSDSHRGCLAHQALDEKTAKHSVDYLKNLGKVWDRHWVPLAGEEDFYLHFNIDITPYAAERLFSQD